MAKLLQEIEWEAPLVSLQASNYEAELFKRLSPWFQSAVLSISATLSSPLLSDIEERLLRWTRETVWYEPRVIQNSTRRLRDEVGESLTLEAIGTAAIGNTLARLSLVRQ